MEHLAGKHIVVVGGGQAGFSIVSKLRSEGFPGKITLVCGESVPPYQRPPLSKSYLLGEMERERLFFRPTSYYDENDITLKLNSWAKAIDRDTKTITLPGESIQYDMLALATGAAPRTLPEEIGGELENIHAIRSITDIDKVKPLFRKGAKVLIVGGGYIGLEAAAVASKLGLKVTLVEAADRVLQRVAAAQTSQHFRALHSDHGVIVLESKGLTMFDRSSNSPASGPETSRYVQDLQSNHGVEVIEGGQLEELVPAEGPKDGLGDPVELGYAGSAKLGGGSEISLDFALVGVGIAPSTQLAEKAGLDVENGICVDEYARTSDESIWAAGDCASFMLNGERIRLESVQNAIGQGEVAALSMIGKGTVYMPVPWFWSDQYDTKLQIAGLNTGYDSVIVRPGKVKEEILAEEAANTGAVTIKRRLEDTPVSHWYYKGDQLLAVDAINDPKAYMVGKKLLEMGRSPAKSVVENPETDLKSLIR